MLRTPYHALLSRHDYDLLRRHEPVLLDQVHWIEERPEALGHDAPVRLFYPSAADKTAHQIELLRGLARHRHTERYHDTD